MRTLTEAVALARGAGRIWWRNLPQMTFWYAAGFVVHRLCNYLSVLLGAQHNIAATLVFVVGLVAMVAAMILTIHACERALPGGRPTDRDGPFETRLEVLALTIGPFLAAYALWGLIADEVSGLFIANIALTGLGGVDQWSVNMQWIQLYVVLAAIAWLARRALARLGRRFSSPWLLLPTVLTEGLWVVAWLFVAITLFGRLHSWFESRAIWQGAVELWNALVARLPALQLPFELTLPQIVTAAAGWFWHTLLPGVAHDVLLPLVWLALTATVFGWRSGSARDVLAGSRLEGRVSRIEARFGSRTSGGLGRVLVATGTLLTGDLRDRVLPAAHAFRLILRAGLRFVGAYLVVAALAGTIPTWAYLGLDSLLGGAAQSDYLARLAYVEFAVGWTSTVAVAVYVAALARIRSISTLGPAISAVSEVSGVPAGSSRRIPSKSAG